MPIDHKFSVGEKVRVKRGLYAGREGVVSSINNMMITVDLYGPDQIRIGCYATELEPSLEGILYTGNRDHPSSMVYAKQVYDALVRQYSQDRDPFHVIKVKFSGPATIVFFDDNTKIVVKCSENDIYDPEKAIMIAVMRKISGKTSSGFSKWLGKMTGVKDDHPMTCREWIAENHPEKLDEREVGGVCGCPYHVFGLGVSKLCHEIGSTFNPVGPNICCRKCWDQTIPPKVLAKLTKDMTEDK